MSPQSYTFVYATIILFVSGANTLNTLPKWRYEDPASGEQVYCDWCRPGEYISRACTVQSSTVCLPCPREHYAEQYNHLTDCRRCHQCNLMNNRHEHETIPCTPVQNRQCECDNGYFKPPKSPICLQHTKCQRGHGVIEKGTHQTDTRCTRCRSGTFSDEMSSTAECRAHTDCAARGEHVFRRGNHRRNNVCGIVADTASNDTTELHYSGGVKSHVNSIFLALFIVAFFIVIYMLVVVSYKLKMGQQRYGIDFGREQHHNELVIDDNDDSNEMPISKKQFKLYNRRIMVELRRQKEAERIAFDLCQRVEEENIHLKNQVESEKGEVARLKDKITHFPTKNMITYSFSRKPCGIAVIINNIHFEDMADRGGAEGDTGRLREAFESLSFTAMTFSDLDHSKMVATIKDQAKADHSNYDCFACCIMSHGTTGKVFSSDDVGLDICDLMKLFNANKCPSLKGKPKLFFIQACQGKKIQGKESIEGDLDATPGEDVPLNFICNEADFFLGLSTVPGHISKRGQDGAPYVFHLAKLLKDFGPTHDLSAIMAMVCDKMNDINDDTFGWISSYHSTLRKKVFFSTN